MILSHCSLGLTLSNHISFVLLSLLVFHNNHASLCPLNTAASLSLLLEQLYAPPLHVLSLLLLSHFCLHSITLLELLSAMPSKPIISRFLSPMRLYSSLFSLWFPPSVAIPDCFPSQIFRPTSWFPRIPPRSSHVCVVTRHFGARLTS